MVIGGSKRLAAVEGELGYAKQDVERLRAELDRERNHRRFAGPRLTLPPVFAEAFGVTVTGVTTDAGAMSTTFTIGDWAQCTVHAGADKLVLTPTRHQGVGPLTVSLQGESSGDFDGDSAADIHAWLVAAETGVTTSPWEMADMLNAALTKPTI